MEYAGEVDALGVGVTMWKVGDRVMGIVGGGGHAEFLCVHEREVIPAPNAMAWEDVAAIPKHSSHRLRRALQPTRPSRRRDGADSRRRQRSWNSGFKWHAWRGHGDRDCPFRGEARTREAARSGRRDRCIARRLGAQVESAIGAERVHAVMDLVGGNYLDGNLRVAGLRGVSSSLD